MFSVEMMHRIREHELQAFTRHLPANSDILEIGGGTGYQARAFAALGHRVESVDLANAPCREARVYPVREYDGRHLPYADRSFDVVLSSNVLEHVEDIPAMLAETRRVLRPEGVALHAMPSASWRFWTLVAGLADMPAHIAASALSPFRLAKGVAARLAPIPHGARGNAVTEIVTFSRGAWRRAFVRAGWELYSVEPMGLFYTGWFALGERLPTASRERASAWLGSSCVLYCARPSVFEHEQQNDGHSAHAEYEQRKWPEARAS